MTDDAYEYSQEFIPADDPAERLTRNDGWWASVLLLGLVFGPEVIVNPALPPFRIADFVILVLLVLRLRSSPTLYGGYLFSYRIRRLVVWMGLFILMLVGSTALNTASGRYPFYYKNLFFPIVFVRMVLVSVIAASFYWGPRQQRQFFKGLFLIAGLCMVIAVAQKRGMGFITAWVDRLYLASEAQIVGQARESEISRVTGTFGNPNVFSGILVMLSASFWAITIQLRSYVAFAVFIALGLTVLTTTGSRTGLFGYFLVASAGVILSMRKGSRIYAVVFLIFFVAVSLLVLPAIIDALPVNPRVKEFVFTPSGVLEGLRSRISIWQDAFAVAAESPLIGVGATKTVDQLTDNGYVQTYLRMGFLGLLIYLGMLVMLFRTGFTGWRCAITGWQRGLILGAFLVLINHCLFEWTGDFFWHIRYGAVLAAFLGILCGCARQLAVESAYAEMMESQQSQDIE